MKNPTPLALSATPPKPMPTCLLATVNPSGKLVDIKDFKSEDFDFPAMCHSLSNICRYNGHTTYNYSVARHSFLVAELVSLMGGSPEEVLAALIHDGPEYLIGDFLSPLLRSEPALMELNERLTVPIAYAIAKSVGLDEPYSPMAYPMVHLADRMASELERRVFFPAAPEWVNQNILDQIDELFEALGISHDPAVGVPHLWGNLVVPHTHQADMMLYMHTLANHAAATGGKQL